jgi:hypothetical protein
MIAKFTCLNEECEQPENSIEINSPEDLTGKLFYCCWCGKVYSGTHKKKGSESWLECIPFKGIEATSTNGPHKSSQTGEMLWEYNGDHITRKVYAWIVGWDPKTIWCKAQKAKDKEICAKFDERCKNRRSLIPPLNKDDILPLTHKKKIIIDE